MISGTTALIAHIGWPTHAFKAPMIYNPYFERAGVDAVVVPMGCRDEHYPTFLRAVFTLENIRGALITMPHKVSTVTLLDVRSPAVQIAGACNAVRRDADGPTGRRPVRRRRVRSWPAPQRLHRRRRPRAGRRRGRRRLGDRGVSRGSRRGVDRRFRRARRCGGSACRAAAVALPGAPRPNRSNDPAGLRHRRQCDAVGNE
jgi:hypothetical protein